MSTNKADKPPLGIKPQWLHDLSRASDIKDAICRYLEASKEIPLIWIVEYNSIVNRADESKTEVVTKAIGVLNKIIREQGSDT